MELLIKSPIQVINRLYRRKNIHPDKFEIFLNALDNYFYYTDRAKKIEETDENIHQYLGDFLNVFYPNSEQKHKFYKEIAETNWVISETENENIQLLFNIKNATNTAEMISVENPNKKALHELIISYLQEKIIDENQELKHLVITNLDDFFIFDVAEFDSQFYGNNALVEEFKKWELTQFDEESLDRIYDFLNEFLEQNSIELNPLHFNLLEIQPDLEAFKHTENQNNNLESERRLAAIYKIFAPDFLLKQFHENDSNELNEKFYFELLHILGLEEKTESGRKVIIRCSNPNVGSLLENTITKLRTEDLLYGLRKQKQFGESDEERYFNVAFDLMITWLNRILFLKLLEAQLIIYNAEDDDKATFQFLHPSKMTEFDTLNTLFFEVLSIPEKEREKHITTLYGRIPYLNSSLFEVTELERRTLRISNIKDSTLLPIYENSILKKTTEEITLDTDNQLIELPTLKYLLDFLEAYDFGADESESILKTETKPLINTTILGLVLEKINGYQEGSFITPNHILMNMSRVTLRQIVIDKFNDEINGFGVNVNTFEELQAFCQKLYKTTNLTKANQLINSITICDPSVGSGRFLVAALNELLVIKSELGVLCDRNHKSLLGKINLQIVNDELIITNHQNVPFVYKVSFASGLRKLVPELQEIQETIFLEKKYLIEHCLFGVDINPNAVKICRLRLWIELLKNAYYRQGRNTQLETLPNIDINIKTGNALISRFALDSDLNEVFKKTEYSVEEYKRSVKAYKTEANKKEKRKLSEYLEEIKSEFQITFDKRQLEKIAKVRGKKDQLELQITYNRNLGYQPTEKELDDLNKFTNSLSKREQEKAEILSSDIYQNAFEWRFEFPEVLDENGVFNGFDIVIGNPPNTKASLIKPLKFALKKTFVVYQSNVDLYIYFFELSRNLLQENGMSHLITPNNWLKTKSTTTLRNLLSKSKLIKIEDYEKQQLFKDFSTTTAISQFSKQEIATERIFSAIKIQKQ